jgi:hypothetical protein
MTVSCMQTAYQPVEEIVCLMRAPIVPTLHQRELRDGTLARDVAGDSSLRKIEQNRTRKPVSS